MMGAIAAFVMMNILPNRTVSYYVEPVKPFVALESDGSMKTETTEIPPIKPEQDDIAKLIDDPLLIKIAWCESFLQQFDKDGKVLKSFLGTDDWGIFQISKPAWLDVANKLGYNIETVDGNIKMGKYIYENYGTKPWNASKKCWSKMS